MKVEMQSGSSDFDESEDSRHRARSSFYATSRKLWSNAKTSSASTHSNSGLASQRRDSDQSDEDFEFVITRSRRAMKVKKPSVDQHDNYRRFDDAPDHGRPNGHPSTHSNSPRHRTRGPARHSNYRPVGHPGLERKIDFDPFDSSSEGSPEEEGSRHSSFHSESRHEDLTPLRPHYSHENSPEFETNQSTVSFSTPTYSPRPKKRQACRRFFTKIKFFFKSVGFKIKRCFTRSKTYLSLMIKGRKNRRRNRKERDRLLENQQCYTDLDEAETPRKPRTVYRQKIVVPFNLNSNSTSSFEDLEPPVQKKRSKFGGLRIRSRKPKYANPQKTMKHVKLHSFPDG